MSVSVRVLFDQPQCETAPLLRDRLARCASATLVAGFITVEGIEAIAAPIRVHPGKLARLVVGAGTWRAFEAMDRLLKSGVSPDALFVHLGHSRETGATATHRFYRYHPMLHSKVYLFEMDDGTTCAFVGSHNLTGFALLGLNGEAGVMLEGGRDEPEFTDLRKHVTEAVNQAIPYNPNMKDAYSWWTTQFLEGLRAKANDIPDPDKAQAKRTVVVIAACNAYPLPQNDDVIYFEIQSALGPSIRSVDVEIHIYIFATLPRSSAAALIDLSLATASLWCTAAGLEMDGGGEQLHADWFIDNRRQPELKRVRKPFQPTPAPGMEQIRARVRGSIFGKFTYLFDRGRVDWVPLFDRDQGKALIVASEEARAILTPLELVPPENLPWLPVRGLAPVEPSSSAVYREALKESAPESGAFILFSLRRRKLEKPKRKQ